MAVVAAAVEVVDWLRTEISKVDEQHGGGEWRLYVGRGLAIANLAFWSFNLFGFLLPLYLPKAFKKYYSEGYKGKEIQHITTPSCDLK
ncbi:hypothetical protein RHMOL_Rhmol13G0184400 [Rhododendron molle]|uniref:Uncharacterized protein n=1 Tax=Rhododendron molle TaxID=49168 RepID=A0ACC0L9S6_RHOML|nr:hypothetical protein RHMOL_Rhmol13G0184400 [Rhododendron molle]